MVLLALVVKLNWACATLDDINKHNAIKMLNIVGSGWVFIGWIHGVAGAA